MQLQAMIATHTPLPLHTSNTFPTAIQYDPER